VAPLSALHGTVAQPPLVMPPPAQPVPAKIEFADGTFQPTWDSLRRYQCPEWFRDAKLGFWGILSPQSLPEAGDWYARNMYIEGHRDNRFHNEHFGHPSQFGYKDLAVRWKAERFDPDRLMAVYNIKDMNHRIGHDHGEYVDGIAVQDVERGGLSDIKSQPR
jgi:hypothetical protein